MNLFWPADPRTITEEAGTRGGAHYGIDFGLPIGTPVTAPFDGTVVWAGDDGASGYYAPADVWANGPALVMDFQRGDGLISRFAHLNGFHASVGEFVRAGEWLAFSGNTGFSTGPHLHWELRWNRSFGGNGWVNPREFDPQIFRKPAPVQVPKIVEDDMSKPMLAMKLDGGPMNTLGVLIEPDGTVVGLTGDQFGFWEKVAKIEPIFCKNPGHWEYLMSVIENRRKRNNVTISADDVATLTAAVRGALDTSAKVTAEDVAAALQITVKNS